MMSPHDIEHNLQICRELALLGNYDSAILFYESIILSIQSHTAQSTLQERWIHAQEMINKEFQAVKAIKSELSGFKDRKVGRKSIMDQDPDVWAAPDPLPPRQAAQKLKETASLPSWARKTTPKSTPTKVKTPKKPVPNATYILFI
jgi:katanin p60 ATPase-containing subunit A1